MDRAPALEDFPNGQVKRYFPRERECMSKKIVTAVYQSVTEGSSWHIGCLEGIDGIASLVTRLFCTDCGGRWATETSWDQEISSRVCEE